MKRAEDFLAELAERSGAEQGAGSVEMDGAEQRLADSLPQLAEMSRLIESRAVALLAIREHGRRELQRKLLDKFPETAEWLEEVRQPAGTLKELIVDVLDYCVEQNWQSDERFVENGVNSLMNKGQGPLKIRQKLQQACSSQDLIEAYLDVEPSDWIDLARQVMEKKYGDSQRPSAQKELAKRVRFLQSRGFQNDTIWKAFS